MGNSRIFLTAFLTAMLTLVGASKARADRVGHDYRPLAETIHHHQVAPHLSVRTLYRNGTGGLSSDALKTFNAVAFDQAQVWADTILEGDYEAEGNTRLDRVEAYYRNESLVAYRITYSERAWYIGDCDPQRARLNCQEGRITESSFVSPQFSSWLRDEQAYAEFQ